MIISAFFTGIAALLVITGPRQSSTARLSFDHEFNQRSLLLRQQLVAIGLHFDSEAKRMKDELHKPREALYQSCIALEESTARLIRCLEAHGL